MTGRDSGSSKRIVYRAMRVKLPGIIYVNSRANVGASRSLLRHTRHAHDD
jgi:hypothetical protein